MTYSDDTAWAANTYEDGAVKKTNLEKLKTDEEQSPGMKICHFFCGRQELALFAGASLLELLLGQGFVRERAETSIWAWIVRSHL